jgi:hypothetical protein
MRKNGCLKRQKEVTGRQMKKVGKRHTNKKQTSEEGTKKYRHMKWSHMVDSRRASGEVVQDLGSCCMVHVLLVVLPEQITYFGVLL